MDQRSMLIALHESKGIGWKTILRLMEGTDNLARLPETEEGDLVALGFPEGKAKAVLQAIREPGGGRITTAESMILPSRTLIVSSAVPVQTITIFDADYPERLKRTSQPPWVLYVRGDLRLMEKPSIAVVGTRNPTAYGKKVAEDLSADLSCSGVCVVSGLARGIDSMAHRGALRGQGSTIAVMGCAADTVYPPENISLYREIAEQGLVLSEYPAGTPAHPGLFPLRNRIIAGLTLGTVVVEAALRSGSLITADQALEESRDVFAVPGPITSPKSAGALALLKQGAKLVTEAADILQEYPSLAAKASVLQARPDEIPLPPEEEKIYRMITHEPVTIDQLLGQCQTNFGHLHSILLSLCLKNKIKQLPGAAYVTI